jgi:hypothetical protein
MADLVESAQIASSSSSVPEMDERSLELQANSTTISTTVKLIPKFGKETL